MTTTSSTTSASSTSTSATTTTSSTSATTKSATAQLLSSLGTGSGIDSASIVGSLVQAQYATKLDTLSSKYDTLTAQLSSVSTLKGSITGFVSALTTLIKGGSLTTQPTSANGAVVTASALGGAKLAGLAATVEVDRLASAQVTTMGTAVAADQSIGSGTLTFAFADGTSHAVTIDPAKTSVADVAAQINAGGAGVTATVITGADGTVRLSLKGATGNAQAFTVSVDTGSDPNGDTSLGVLATDGSGDMTTTSTAQNAQLKVDGVAVERTSNSVSDLIAGVKLQLVSAAPGQPVSLGSETPTANLGQAVSDVVDTFNDLMGQLKSATDPITGDLRADPAAKALLQSLRTLTTTSLVRNAASGTPTTLAEIGVGTNRDGTLSVDADQLSAALTSHADSVEAMFADSTGVLKSGLLGTLSTISTTATSSIWGLGASASRYTQAQSDITDQKAKIADQEDAMTTRLTQQFAAMDSRVSAYKSIQSFLTQQIDAWTKSNND